MEYDVLRRHEGDKLYERGDVRQAKPDEVKHLVANGVLREAGAKAEGAPSNKAEGTAPQNKGGTERHRDDGPTVTEYVAAGYRASAYPPEGYASRSTPEEIQAAIAAQEQRSELEKLTNKQLQEIAQSEEIAVESSDNKQTLISKIEAGREAKS